MNSSPDDIQVAAGVPTWTRRRVFALIAPCDRLKTRRFTLIELLVVIAIIAVLAAMMLPALQGAKATAQSALCVSNQKQMHTAFAMYVSDWDRIPIAQFGYTHADTRTPACAQILPCVRWYAQLAELMGMANGVTPAYPGFYFVPRDPGVFICPGDSGRRLGTAGGFRSGQRCPNGFDARWSNYTGGGMAHDGYSHDSYMLWGTYGYNYLFLGNACQRTPLPVSRIAKPAGTVAFGDTHFETGDPLYAPAYLLYRDPDVNTMGRRHRQGGNYTFIDGHIEFRSNIDAAREYETTRTTAAWSVPGSTMFSSGFNVYSVATWP